MGVMVWVVLGLVLGLGSLFLMQQLQRRREAASAPAGRRAVGKPAAGKERPRNPFAAVTIRPSLEDPCTAVMTMQHVRYLAVRAPRLPVPGCDKERCDCGYIRHADRRAPGDRRDAFAQFGGYKPNLGTERRTPDRGRRKSG